MVGPWSDITPCIKSKIPRLAASLQGLHCLQMSHVGVLSKQTFIMTMHSFQTMASRAFLQFGIATSFLVVFVMKDGKRELIQKVLSEGVQL